MPAERRQVTTRLTTSSPSGNPAVRPSRRRSALPAVHNDLHARTTSAEFARGSDIHHHHHNGTGATKTTAAAAATPAATPAPTTPTPTTTTIAAPTPRPTHSRGLSRSSRPQSVYAIVEAYRPLAYSIEKAEQEARKRAAAQAAQQAAATPVSPVDTDMMDLDEPLLSPVASSPLQTVDEFGVLQPPSPIAAAAYAAHAPAAAAPIVSAPVRSPSPSLEQRGAEECISGRGMLKRGYHIICDTTLEDSEEARWAAIKRMEAQLRELDKSFSRVAPPSRRRTSTATHASTASVAASFSVASRAAWNV